MNSITPVELKAKLDAGEKLFLLDVREAWEYALCSIEESINISISDIDRMQNEIKPDDETIVICHHGMRSFQIANYLEGIGYSKITNLEGGVDAWATAVDADMAQY
jgi:rhodanese-related sulfurtransferase